GQVRAQARRQTAARHRMPLIADAAGIEYQRVFLIADVTGWAWPCRHQARALIAMEETAIREQARGTRRPALAGLLPAHRPLDRREIRVLTRGQRGEAPEVERTAALVPIGAQRGVFGEDLIRTLKLEAARIAHA